MHEKCKCKHNWNKHCKYAQGMIWKELTVQDYIFKRTSQLKNESTRKPELIPFRIISNLGIHIMLLMLSLLDVLCCSSIIIFLNKTLSLFKSVKVLKKLKAVNVYYKTNRLKEVQILWEVFSWTVWVMKRIKVHLKGRIKENNLGSWWILLFDVWHVSSSGAFFVP